MPSPRKKITFFASPAAKAAGEHADAKTAASNNFFIIYSYKFLWWLAEH
jgi:hypothetical protein